MPRGEIGTMTARTSRNKPGAARCGVKRAAISVYADPIAPSGCGIVAGVWQHEASWRSCRCVELAFLRGPAARPRAHPPSRGVLEMHDPFTQPELMGHSWSHGPQFA